MHDNTRQKLDVILNRKLNKTFDLNQVIRLEVEFLMSADFLKMRSEFLKTLNSAPTSN